MLPRYRFLALCTTKEPTTCWKKKTKGSLTTTLHKRVGVNETGFSKTEIDCKSMQYRDMGYSEAGPDKIVGAPGKWTDTVSGSSKSDLMNFACGGKL